MDEQFAIKNNNWIRCQSKSRPGQFYMFNQKTGETRWCTEYTPNTQLNISAKIKMNTPAQDRLKRLQKNLEKMRQKDSSVAKAKNKRLDFSSGKQTVDIVKAITPSANTEASTSKSTENRETNTLSKGTTDKSNSQKNIDKNSPLVDTEKQENVQSSGKKNIELPDNLAKQPENTSKRKPDKRNHDKIVNVPCDYIPKKLNQSTIDSVCSPKKNRKSDDLKTNLDKTSLMPQKVVECDLNANINSPKEQKSNIMSVFKGYCSSLYNKIIHPIKGKNVDNTRKQSNLSHNSRPSFKSKKTVLKITKEDYRIQETPLKPSNTTNTTVFLPSSATSANDRLDRLRKSLTEQQTFSNQVQHESSSISMKYDEPELMDWQPIGEENTTCKGSDFWGIVNENLLRIGADEKQHKQQWKKDHYYFVVDTNVLLENVTFVKDLANTKLCDTAGSIIYIPYCVLQELDKLKMHSAKESIKIRSIRAIHFIHNAIKTNSQHVQAQSSADEIKHLIKVTSADDSILNCCLQVKEHIENVLFLTEDINLRNKAMSSHILVSTRSDLMSKHESIL